MPRFPFSPDPLSSPKVTALAGGVGGARLAHGLAQCLPPKNLAVIVNTGDDFEHYGLKICPDLDTVCYTLAGIANPDTGWGRSDETWHVLDNLNALGGATWFRLGDRDLATHLERTLRLQEGQCLSQITRDFCHAWGVQPSILPMTDNPLSTWVDTDEGEMPFQEYFVRRKCQPKVKGFRFATMHARPAPGVLNAIQQADLIVLCPSNPWVSVDPILAVPGIREALQTQSVVAVSPILGGKAVKGPAAKMCIELGIPPSALAVAQHYRSLLSGFVLDRIDKDQQIEIQAMGIQTLVTDILMRTVVDRLRLAGEVVSFGIRI